MAGPLKIYDISIDEDREPTQGDIDAMEAAIRYLAFRCEVIALIGQRSPFQVADIKMSARERCDARYRRLCMIRDIWEHGNPKKLAEDYPDEPKVAP